MNCWEAVLYAAHLTGLKSKSQITDAITRVKSGDLSGGVMGQAADAAIPRFVRSILRAPAGRVVRPPDASGSVPIDVPPHSLRQGHVVVFGWEGQHVALATGRVQPIATQAARDGLNRTQGDQVLELDAPTNGVVASTIEDVMSRNSPYNTVISWGFLP
jgi:hypothetical protein